MKINTKITIFLICAISFLLLGVLFDFVFVDQYHMEKPKGEEYSIVYYFIQLTHIMNITVILWFSSLLLVREKKKLDDFSALVVVISSLVWIVYFIPLIILILRDFSVMFFNNVPIGWSGDNIWFSPELYSTLDFLETTSVHLVLPLLVIYTSFSLSLKTKMKNYIITTLFLLIYYVIAVTAVSSFDVQDPYHIFDYSSKTWVIIINLIFALILWTLSLGLTYAVNRIDSLNWIKARKPRDY